MGSIKGPRAAVLSRLLSGDLPNRKMYRAWMLIEPGVIERAESAEICSYSRRAGRAGIMDVGSYLTMKIEEDIKAGKKYRVSF